MNQLKLKDISYSYHNPSGARQVLTKINATFKEGQLYAIIGESGSGKTTLLSLLAGLDSLQTGDICFNNQSIRQIGATDYRLKYVNIVFQAYNLITYLTARENVAVAIEFDGRDNNPDKYLEQVGLTREEGGRLINKLSGGQQQRVAIARALASDSPVILADEPTGNLDSKTEGKVIELFRNLAHDNHKIVIVVTHSQKVADYADTVFELKDGKLTQKKP